MQSPVTELVRASRNGQGLPPQVEDPATLDLLAQLVEEAIKADWRHDQLVDALARGGRTTETAKRFGITPYSVSHFRQRNADEIAARMAEIGGVEW